jgi:hypothetical protein
MRTKRWPILDLDEGAGEAEIRRAYARCLRQNGPDDDPDAFQALRAEYDSAIASLRGKKTEPAYVPVEPEPRPSPKVDIVSEGVRARVEIAAAIAVGDVLGACDRYDRARRENEIGLADQMEIELMLARCILANTTLLPSELEQIARRYHWDDAISGFPLGAAIIEKYRFNDSAKDVPKASKPPKPPKPPKAVRVVTPHGELARKWNWGAFCLTPFWLLKNGRPLIGAFYLLAVVVFVAIPLFQCVFVGISVWYGVQGKRIALASRTWASDAQFESTQNRWRNWGIPSFVAFVCLNVTLLIISKLGHVHAAVHHVTASTI